MAAYNTNTQQVFTERLAALGRTLYQCLPVDLLSLRPDMLLLLRRRLVMTQRSERRHQGKNDVCAKTAEGVRYMSELARVMSAVNNSAPVTTWKKALILPGAILRRPGRRCKRFRRQSALRQDISLQWHRVGSFLSGRNGSEEDGSKCHGAKKASSSAGLLCFAAALRRGGCNMVCFGKN